MRSSSWYKTVHFSRWRMCVTSGRNRCYQDRMDKFQGKYRDKFEQCDSVPQEEARTERRRERERERGREICNSSVASHRWWVEASSGAPKLARIKGGYKTSAEHQSSNQGTAATMRAFVVSSPRPRFLISPISRVLFPYISPLPSCLPSSSPVAVYFFRLLLSNSLLARTGDFSRRMTGPRRIRCSFAIAIEIEIETGIGVPSEGGGRENTGESKREGRVHREYCVRCQCTPW